MDSWIFAEGGFVPVEVRGGPAAELTLALILRVVARLRACLEVDLQHRRCGLRRRGIALDREMAGLVLVVPPVASDHTVRSRKARQCGEVHFRKAREACRLVRIRPGRRRRSRRSWRRHDHGGGFVTAAVPVIPATVAVTVTEPAATPIVAPVESTVAIALLLEVHVSFWPVITLLFWSFTVALSCSFAPTVAADVAGETLTEATTGVTGTVGAVAVVVPLAMFDATPSTAFRLSVPRYVTSSKL